ARQIVTQGLERATKLVGLARGRITRVDRLDAVGAELLLGARDRVLVPVEKVFDLQEQVDVTPRVHPLAAPRLLGPDRAELRLPVAEHMGLHAYDLGGFADPEEELVGELARHSASCPRLSSRGATHSEGDGEAENPGSSRSSSSSSSSDPRPVASPSLRACLRSWLGLKVSTRRALMVI